MSNPTSDLVIRLRTKMKHSAAYSVRENEDRLVALGKEAAAKIERMECALQTLLPGLVLDLRHAELDDDKDAMRSRIQTVEEGLSDD